jgi:hypothetical protein
MELCVLGVTDDDFERIFIAWIALQFSAGSDFFVFFDREFSNFQIKISIQSASFLCVGV